MSNSLTNIENSLKKMLSLDELFLEALKENLFDPVWYRMHYKKEHLSAYDAFKDYLDKSRFSPVSPSLIFDGENYQKRYIDVYSAGLGALEHYLNFGRIEKRTYSPYVEGWNGRSQIISTVKHEPIDTKLKIAFVLHIFYEDYINRFALALENFPSSIDLFVSVTDKSYVEIAKSRFASITSVKKMKVLVVPNRGRNFGPLLVEFSEDVKIYDWVCHLHSKKSLYSGREQTQWSDYLSEYMAKDRDVICRLLNILHSDEKIGVYYPVSFWMMPSWVNHVTKNKSFLIDWNRRFNLIESSDFLAYPVGGMFWFKPKALAQLFDSDFSYDDFPEEPLPNDGSMLHALERVIGGLASKNGFEQLFYNVRDGSFTKDHSYIYNGYDESSENFLNLLLPFDVVSFDIFDTVVRRKYTHPDYAKYKLGKILQKHNLVKDPEEFVSIRNECEAELRRENSFQGDVAINQIYELIGKKLGLDPNSSNSLMRYEFELDFELLEAKDEIVSTINSLQDSGKEVWFISDTYYLSEHIAKILKKAGVSGYYKAFISSEIQKRKDNGTMWGHVKGYLGERGIESYIHVGDNVVSDAQIPGDIGLLTYHILHPLDKWEALGFMSVLRDTKVDESEVLKWGGMVSKFGRSPFIGE